MACSTRAEGEGTLGRGWGPEHRGAGSDSSAVSSKYRTDNLILPVVYGNFTL